MARGISCGFIPAISNRMSDIVIAWTDGACIMYKCQTEGKNWFVRLTERARRKLDSSYINKIRKLNESMPFIRKANSIEM